MGHDEEHEGKLINPETDIPFMRWRRKLINLVDGPVIWFRKTVVEPNRKQYNWYHKQYRRVPSIDECYTDDMVCIFEADQQYKRDRKIDLHIVALLHRRYDECCVYEYPNHGKICDKYWKVYEEHLDNWFIKYGDLGAHGKARDALNKQKHRMIWERRYGPVGTGKIPIAQKEKQAS